MSFATSKRLISTLRARLTVWHLSILAVMLTLFATLCYVMLVRSLYGHHDEELARQADVLLASLGATPLAQADIRQALVGTPIASRFVMIRDNRGELVYRDPVLDSSEPNIGRHEMLVHAASTASQSAEFFTVTLERSGEVRFLCLPIRQTDAYLQIGDPLGDVRNMIRTVAITCLPLIPLVLLLSGVGSWMTTKRALAPVHAIAETLQDIQATNLSRRVEVHPLDAELSLLVTTLNQLLDRLQRAFESLRQFAGDVSHQILTPLTVIKATLDDVLRDRDRALKEASRLHEVTLDVNDIRAIIADLQSFALADAPIQHAAEANLSEIVRDASELVSALGELGNVMVQADVKSGVIVPGDAVRLKQIVLNLGDNAVKYTQPEGHVTIRLTVTGETAVLQVADTGIGIAPQDVPRIFDRLFRTDAADRSTKGAGLGLAIVKRIVEAHGGTITVDSAPGVGSTFTVTLPRARRE